MLEDLVNHASEGEQISVIFVDIDDLKWPCDNFGHAAGDGSIQAVARAIEEIAGGDCTVTRFGGDEFLIVAPDFRVEKARKLAETIRLSNANVSLEANGCEFECPTVTIGIACFPDDGATAPELLEAANAALTQGKARGKNCVVAASELSAENC